MANLVKGTNISLVTTLTPPNCRITGLTAGEAIAQGDAVYVKSDGLIWRSNGTAATAPAKCWGLAASGAAVGEPVTILRNCLVNYAAATLTPGAAYYVSATAGALSDAATTGGTAPVAYAFTSSVILVTGSAY